MPWFCLWFVVLFATPLSVAIQNRADLEFKLWLLASSLLLLTTILAMIGGWFTGRLSRAAQDKTVAAVLAAACVLTLQSNLIHPLTYFGRFDGEIVLFRQYGAWFWVEWWGFILVLPLVFIMLRRWPRAIGLAIVLPLVSVTLNLVQAAIQPATIAAPVEAYDDSVFEFSSEANLVHLLPDGLQTDLLIEVLQNNPELAAELSGFTVFEDNLGPYHGTAPALPALLTGQAFDFSRGHIYRWIEPFIDQEAYQNDLIEQGWTVNMVPIHPVYCVDRVHSCIARPFNDWKSRGYEHFRGGGLARSVAVLADLTLYRLSPSFLKEKIHNQGAWRFAGITADGSSPFPDPVLREWTDQMQVREGPPSYRFYHYIGTHQPAFWDETCTRLDQPLRQRSDYLAQTRCLLGSLADFVRSLKARGIYDQTAIILSADHGLSVMPTSKQSQGGRIQLPAGLLPKSRAALMVKPMHDRDSLRFSDFPSSLLDVAGLALALASGSGIPFAMDSEGMKRTRHFYHYSIEGMRRWADLPIAHNTYGVTGPVLDPGSWSLDGMAVEGLAPSHYANMNYKNVADFVVGAEVRIGDEDQKAAWVRQPQVGMLVGFHEEAPADWRLSIKVHLPEWISEQGVSVRVNGVLLFASQQVENTADYWTHLDILVPKDKVLTGNNFIQLNFEKMYPQPNSETRKAAALLGGIDSSIDSDQNKIMNQNF